jgi:hypothetical protein
MRTFIVFPYYCSAGDLEYVVLVANDEERALQLVAERECKFKDNQYPLRLDEIETEVEDIILEQWFVEE